MDGYLLKIEYPLNVHPMNVHNEGKIKKWHADIY